MTHCADKEQLEAFRATVRRFLDREVVPNMREWRKQGQVPREAWLMAGRAGLLGVSIPDQYGGAGGDFRHEIVIIEELGRIGFYDFAIPLHSAIVAPYIVHYGSDEQKQRWLPKFASGEIIGAIAMTEPGAGSDLQAIQTRARRVTNGYRLSGQKIFVSNGQTANLILIAAKTARAVGAKGMSLFALETEGAEGFRRGRNLEKIGNHAQDTSELFFDEVHLEVSNLIGTEENSGFYQLMAQLPQERLIIAVQAVAAMETAIAATVEYTKQRKAFGTRILDFQNSRFTLAECTTEAAIARVFVEDCTSKLLAGTLNGTTAAMAKYWTTDKQSEIMDRCLQLFGGYGCMAEYPISQMWADARVHRIYGGTNEIMKELISRSISGAGGDDVLTGRIDASV
jgi:acyl-CoA dehydrogenase